MDSCQEIFDQLVDAIRKRDDLASQVYALQKSMDGLDTDRVEAHNQVVKLERRMMALAAGMNGRQDRELRAAEQSNLTDLPE